jgi:hypothetical protein
MTGSALEPGQRHPGSLAFARRRSHRKTSVIVLLRGCVQHPFGLIAKPFSLAARPFGATTSTHFLSRRWVGKCHCGIRIALFFRKVTACLGKAHANALAPQLLYTTESGGSSGPARRSGAPLEQPPHQQTLPYGCRESRIDTPCPAMYARGRAHFADAVNSRRFAPR